MLSVRHAQARGFADHGWLQSHHSFSFASYYDPAHTQFRALRVINEDWIAPGRGFGSHPHKDMEILTCVLSGALAHEDSMGTGSVIVPGELQRMCAGTGVTHSEMNTSTTEPVHLLQIWLIPRAANLQPAYSQRAFDPRALRDALVCLASPDGRENSMTIEADCILSRGRLGANERVTVPISQGRGIWLQVAQGTLIANGHTLGPGDGCAITDEKAVTLTGIDASDVLVFDLA